VHTIDIYRFSKISHSLDVVGQIPSAKSSQAAVSVADNKIVVAGGFDKAYFTTNVWIGSCDPQ